MNATRNPHRPRKRGALQGVEIFRLDGDGLAQHLDAIAAAVIGGASLSAGGIGTVAGTIVGALIIGVLNNILDLTNVSAYFQQIIKGCIIVGAVIIDQLKHHGSK